MPRDNSNSRENWKTRMTDKAPSTIEAGEQEIEPEEAEHQAQDVTAAAAATPVEQKPTEEKADEEEEEEEEEAEGIAEKTGKRGGQKLTGRQRKQLKKQKQREARKLAMDVAKDIREVEVTAPAGGDGIPGSMREFLVRLDPNRLLIKQGLAAGMKVDAREFLSPLFCLVLIFLPFAGRFSSLFRQRQAAAADARRVHPQHGVPASAEADGERCVSRWNSEVQLWGEHKNIPHLYL